MARRVTVAPVAARAFRAARVWLTQPGSGADGRARWEALRDARRRLMTHPHLGPPCADHPGYRQLVVSGYRLLYRVSPDTGDGGTAGDVRIVALSGPGQR